MNNNNFQFYFLIVVLLIVFTITIFIFRPFLYTLIFAAVFAVLFQPVQERILKAIGERPGIASLLTLLMIIIFIFTPLIFLSIQISKEAKQLYLIIVEGNGKDAFVDFFRNTLDYFQSYFPISKEYSIDTNRYIKEGLNWLLQNFGSFFSSLAKIFVDFLIFLAALFFLLKDGHKLKKIINKLSPLDSKDNEFIFEKLVAAINSVVKGRLLIALVQGVLATIGFFIFGIPNPVLWGSVTVISALIPGIGTSLVIIPALIFLLVNQHFFPALGLAFWGFILVGLVDNIIGPKFISRGVQIHPFLIFLSVIGGVLYFGPVGFLLGPLTLSMLFSLIDIYISFSKRKAN
ncbi:MAG: AI-2E family transporter [Candidatus Falkowbacteria bacterium]|nr:AI-2E family transporter [Candidatus Falkowbacteria bacterium]